MTEQVLDRQQKHRLAVLRHAEEITGNVAATWAATPMLTSLRMSTSPTATLTSPSCCCWAAKPGPAVTRVAADAAVTQAMTFAWNLFMGLPPTATEIFGGTRGRYPFTWSGPHPSGRRDASATVMLPCDVSGHR